MLHKQMQYSKLFFSMKDSIVMNIFQEDIKTEIYPLAGYIHDIFTIFCSKQALQKVKPKKMSIYIKCLHQKIYTTHIVLWTNKRRICQFPWSGYRPCPPCHLQKVPKNGFFSARTMAVTGVPFPQTVSAVVKHTASIPCVPVAFAEENIFQFQIWWTNRSYWLQLLLCWNISFTCNRIVFVAVNTELSGVNPVRLLKG